MRAAVEKAAADIKSGTVTVHDYMANNAVLDVTLPSLPRRGGGRAMTPAIELRHIDKRFGAVHANRDVNLAVAAGTIHGIVGENGAGKSTLMSILYGFYEADAGEISGRTACRSPSARPPTPSGPASAWSTSTSCWSSR